MSSTGDKIKGMANEAVGNVKQTVGKATDNDKLRAEGKAQEVKGEGQQAVGKAKDAVNWADHGIAGSPPDGSRGHPPTDIDAKEQDQERRHPCAARAADAVEQGVGQRRVQKPDGEQDEQPHHQRQHLLRR